MRTAWFLPEAKSFFHGILASGKPGSCCFESAVCQFSREDHFKKICGKICLLLPIINRDTTLNRYSELRADTAREVAHVFVGVFKPQFYRCFIFLAVTIHHHHQRIQQGRPALMDFLAVFY
jgi:hypothetical protein